MKYRRIVYYILPPLIILAGYFMYFFYYDRVLNFDWGFFNSLSHLLKSIILEYHRFPVHDPWVCGGVDILSRPQNWVFSPFIVSTLLLPPYVANLFSLLVLSFVGAWGMYKLLKHYGVSTTVSIYCSLLFINSSWFGLHIANGHLAFRTLFLLPLVIFVVLTLTNVRKFVALSLIMSFFLVDGGIYAFIYSVVIIFFLIIFNMVPIKVFISDIAKNKLTFILTVVAFLLVSSAKIIPVLSNTIVPGRIPQYHMTLKEIGLSLFYPLQTILPLDLWDRNNFGFHEYGCYIGIFSLLIICWYARNKIFWKNNLKEILLLLIFFWLATGIGGEINPATVLKKIPIIGDAHIETRYFVIFLIFYIIVLARVIDRNIHSKLLLIIVLGVLTMEFLFVKNYSSYEAFDTHYNKIEYPTYITKRKIDFTLIDVPKPEVYLQENIASKRCYEAISVPTRVRHKNQLLYAGEVELLDMSGNIEILEFSPGYINAKYESDRSNTIVFNTNSNNSWIVNKPHKILENNNNLLTVSVEKGKGDITLYYQPGYLKYVIIFYALGVAIYLLILGRGFFNNAKKPKIESNKTK